MLPRRQRLCLRREFQRVYREGKRIRSAYLTLYFFPNSLPYARFGFTVTKKVGKAVERNQVKRRLREACRCSLDFFPVGYDFIFIAHTSFQSLKGSQVVEQVKGLGQQVENPKK